jgi:hypothetical protein
VFLANKNGIRYDRPVATETTEIKEAMMLNGTCAVDNYTLQNDEFPAKSRGGEGTNML